MGDKADAKTQPALDGSRRKPYRTPRLERLGTLTELTAAIGTRGKNDMGPSPPFLKTS